MTNISDEQKARNAEIKDFEYVMSDKRGRRVIRRILEDAGVFRLSFNHASETLTAFNEGGRNQGLKLLNEVIEITPEHLTEILTGEQ